MPVIHTSRRIDKRRASPGGPGGKPWWSQKERLQAVNAYVVLGKVTLVVATTGIPEDTIRKWKMSTWWKEAEDEIRRSSKIELSGKLQKIVDKTLLELEDRVTNGDYFFNPRTAAWERKKISAQQASKITTDLIDKTLILDKAATEERTTEEGLDLRLKKLAEEMVRFAKGKTIQGEATHVQEIDGSTEVTVLEEGSASGASDSNEASTSGDLDLDESDSSGCDSESQCKSGGDQQESDSEVGEYGPSRSEVPELERSSGQ